MDTLAKAMGIDFGMDIVNKNLTILDALAPTASTSMQRDLMLKKESEIDGLIFEVVRLAHTYNVELPWYTKIAQAFGCNISKKL